VAAVDAAVGQLLEAFAAARSRPRITVLTSDHGEGLGEHGEATHAIFLYQSTLRVPLILHAPDLWPAGVVVEEPVGLIDIAPTLLAALDLDIGLLSPDGVALAPDTPPVQRVLYSESLYALEAYRWSPMFALREGERKVIRSRISHAYDLDRDPDETQDLLTEDLDWGAALLTTLDRRVVEMSATAHRLDSERQPTPEESEALAALGYVGGVREATGPRDDDRLLRLTTELPDASERQGEFDRTHEAEQLIRRREYAQAIAVLEVVLASSPQNVWARMLYAQALGEAGRTREAIVAYEAAAQLRPDLLEIHTNLARLQIRQGDVAAATRHFERALAIEPANVELRIEAAVFLQSKQRFEAGMLLLERGLEVVKEPLPRARLHAAAARLAYQLSDLDRGRAHLERARAVRDDASLRTLAALYLRSERRWQEIVELLRPELSAADGETQQFYGEALQRLGQHEGAARAYRSAIGLADSLHLAHNNLAWALATELGAPQEALPHAARAIELWPDSADYHDTYLEVLERLGRGEEARAHLRSILPRFAASEALRARAERLQ
jgi:tetratricopeptide (TPR) repeat protein